MVTSVDEFLGGLPIASPELEYHAAILDVLTRVQFDRASAASGFGLLRLLSDGRFASKKIDTDVHPIAGSIDENSHLIASLFDGVGESPAWWKANYVLRKSTPEVVAAARWWVERLRTEPDVVHVGIQ